MIHVDACARLSGGNISCMVMHGSCQHVHRPRLIPCQSGIRDPLNVRSGRDSKKRSSSLTATTTTTSAAPAAVPAAAPQGTPAVPSNSTALQLWQQLQQQQLPGEAEVNFPTQPPQLDDLRQERGKGRSSGFGPSSNGKARSSMKGATSAAPSQRCPCRSGLSYEACCLPFLSGQSHAKSAPELARARITAALAGDLQYLVSTTHPRSNLALGGERDLNRRTKKLAAVFRHNQPVVLGMAHCEGDAEGTWVVLAVLEGTKGDLKGTKFPMMTVMARRGQGSSTQHSTAGHTSKQASTSSTRVPTSAEDWLYLQDTNQFPQHQGSETLWRLMQLHIPVALGDDADDDSSSSSSMASREVYFVWTDPVLHLPTAPEAALWEAAAAAAADTRSSSSMSSSKSQGWFVDLLVPQVVQMTAAGLRGGARSGSSTSGASGGVISMDALIQARGS